MIYFAILSLFFLGSSCKYLKNLYSRVENQLKLICLQEMRKVTERIIVWKCEIIKTTRYLSLSNLGEIIGFIKKCFRAVLM